MGSKIWLRGALVVVGLAVVGCQEKVTTRQRLRNDVAYLASDRLEGRGIRTEGLNKAARYIADEFRAAGLKPAPGMADYYQPFDYTTTPGLSADTQLRVDDRELTLGTDFSVTNVSGEGAFTGEIVFAGYGVTASEFGYDDYANIDVTGKTVLIFRYEPIYEAATSQPAATRPATGPLAHTTLPPATTCPASQPAEEIVDAPDVMEIVEQDDADTVPHSKFSDHGWSEHAQLDTKLANAQAHGATAVLLVNPPGIVEADTLSRFERRFAGLDDTAIPVMHITREVADRLLASSGAAPLDYLEKTINRTQSPQSMELAGRMAQGRVAVDRKTIQLKNVVGYLRGVGRNADEIIIVGAHYDHLGRGGMSSLAPGSSDIHNGADDNASGTAAIIEIARLLYAGQKPSRSVVFIAFSGEEEGLIGSARFANNPPFPLERAVAMINLDMVGRVRQNLLYVGGTGTAATLPEIIERADAISPLTLKIMAAGGIGPSDHTSFALHQIPVLFLFSGLHEDYHRPTDDTDRINFEGLAHVTNLAVGLVYRLADAPRSGYISTSDHIGPMRSGTRASLGVVPDYGTDTGNVGVRITGTRPGSPADAAGLKSGDIITAMGDRQIGNLYDLTDALATFDPGTTLTVVVTRDGESIELEATLAPND